MSKLFSYNSQLIRIWCKGIVRCLNSKIPPASIVKKIDERELPPQTVIDQKTVEHLERLSLVNFASAKGIKSLEDAIRFADQIRVIDTTGVEPMISVLEDRSVYLRDDKVTDGNCRKDVMANASVTEEEYFVAPPGNIPLVK